MMNKNKKQLKAKSVLELLTNPNDNDVMHIKKKKIINTNEYLMNNDLNQNTNDNFNKHVQISENKFTNSSKALLQNNAINLNDIFLNKNNVQHNKTSEIITKKSNNIKSILKKNTNIDKTLSSETNDNVLINDTESETNSTSSNGYDEIETNVNEDDINEDDINEDDINEDGINEDNIEDENIEDDLEDNEIIENDNKLKDDDDDEDENELSLTKDNCLYHFEDNIDYDVEKPLTIADNDKRITPAQLFDYEKTRILGIRAKQISMGSKVMIKYEGNLSAIQLAIKELEEGMTPLIIERLRPDNVAERWKIKELIK